MKNLFFVFSLSIGLFASTVVAAVTPVAGCFEHEVSIASEHMCHLIMPSNISDFNMGNRSSVVNIVTPSNGSITVRKEDNTEVKSGDELDLNTRLLVEAIPAQGYVLNSLYAGSLNITSTREFILKSDVTIVATFISEDIDVIAENPFETMIRLGRMSDTPIYTMPAGSSGSSFVTSAMTTGDAVVYPLGYVKDSNVSKHFIVVSKETSLLNAGSDFNLVITENVDPSGQNITFYTDWDRNGEFEKAEGQSSIDSDSKSITKTFSVPSDAKFGKTRIRVRIESSEPSGPNVQVNGKVYDFVVYVMDI